jgi:hypothetical protein
MSIFAGVTAIVNGSDVKVLATLVSHVSFDAIKKAAEAENEPLSITRDEFDLFIARQSRNMCEAGVLDDELRVTGKFTIDL